MNRKQTGSRTDAYARITEKIVAALDEGVRPWVQPWSSHNVKGRVSRPLRHTGEPYTGMNVLLLWSEAVAQGFASTMWMTLRQANELGGKIRKGESGTLVVYASRFTKTETDGQGGETEREIPFLKTYSVFNCDQIDGLPADYYREPEPVTNPVARLEHAERFFANTGAEIRYGGAKAFYSPSSDHIQLPPAESFRDTESLYAVLGHECVHWAGASHRLNRDLSRYHKDMTDRAREELCADIGAALVCADLGIVPELEPRPDHASYVKSWLTVLENDRRAIFQAAAHAQRAVTYLHSLQPDATGKLKEAA